MDISNPSCHRNSSLSDDRCQGVKLNAFINWAMSRVKQERKRIKNAC